jgi:nitrite reductase/ring-hydroxylating ferredoxin subunit/uncharacterized membrane protein
VRSRAQIKAHPIHPSLIPFPFAFLIGALFFDALGLILERSELWRTAGHLTLAGIAAGLLAAVPGAIDYIYTVPPNSSGKKRATKHALGNVAALVAFALAWLSRGNDGAPAMTTLALEIVGSAVLSYSGYLGGTLVIRNMVSVDHRYANAGKWQEASFTTKRGQSLVVGSTDDLKESQMKLLRVNGKRLVLARTADRYVVFDDGCTHRGGSLAGGVLIDGTVQCLWHGSQFDTATGAVECGPAKKAIKVYEVRETKNGEVVLVSPPAS